MGEKGSPAVYIGNFSPDGNTIEGEWEWPGGGYKETMTRTGALGKTSLGRSCHPTSCLAASPSGQRNPVGTSAADRRSEEQLHGRLRPRRASRAHGLDREATDCVWAADRIPEVGGVETPLAELSPAVADAAREANPHLGSRRARTAQSRRNDGDPELTRSHDGHGRGARGTLPRGASRARGS
jgi:hypothetical protein